MQAETMAETSSSTTAAHKLNADLPGPKRFKISLFSPLAPTTKESSDKESDGEPAKFHYSFDLSQSILPTSFVNKINLQRQTTQSLPPLKIPREIDEIPEIDLTDSPSEEENPILKTLIERAEVAETDSESRKINSPKIEEKSKNSKEEKSSPQQVASQEVRSLKSQQQTASNTFTCLRNLGSTCYINCIIQVMRYTPGFAGSIHRLSKQIHYLESMGDEINTEINANKNVAFVKNLHQEINEPKVAYQAVVFTSTHYVEMSEKEKQDRRPVYSPAKFVKTVWTLLTFWSNGSQQDAHEFLQYTIHFINECDSFLRKCQQQFNVKQIPLSAVHSKTAVQSIEKPMLVPKKPQQSRKNKEKTDEKKTDKENMEENGGLIVNEPLSARLVKSIPKVEIKAEGLLRTPTKGGSSAFNLDNKTWPNDEEKPAESGELDEKNLVSKRLREIIKWSACDVASPLSKKSKIVRPMVEGEFCSNEEDSNSIIIIDSDDNDEDGEYVKCAQFECIGSKEVKFDEEFEVELESSSPPTDHKSKIQTAKFKLKKMSVLLEKIDLEKIMRQNEVRVSGEVFAALDEKPPPFQQQQQSQQQATSKQTKRLKNKSKTIASMAQKENLLDLDAITVVDHIKGDSKARRSSGMQNTGMIRLATSLTPPVDAFPSSASLASLPPSPAELLRKYCNSHYTCEMDKLFKGACVTVTECLYCENLRKSPESFYDRSIPVETSHVSHNNNNNDSDWICKFLKNESYLNENSKYMCDRCASKQEAKIYNQYTQMPKILILHLLSYGITSSIDGNLNTQKLSNRARLVSYFEFEYKSEEPIYNNNTNKTPISLRRIKMKGGETVRNSFRLFAVVMHSGATLNSGHYTAFVNYKIIHQSKTFNEEEEKLGSNLANLKNEQTCPCLTESNANGTRQLLEKQKPTESNAGEWLHFDDTKVKILTNTEFQKKIVDSSFDSPYILFYVKT